MPNSQTNGTIVESELYLPSIARGGREAERAVHNEIWATDPPLVLDDFKNCLCYLLCMLLSLTKPRPVLAKPRLE